jgi:hypothetical protein
MTTSTTVDPVSTCIVRWSAFFNWKESNFLMNALVFTTLQQSISIFTIQMNLRSGIIKWRDTQRKRIIITQKKKEDRSSTAKHNLKNEETCRNQKWRRKRRKRRKRRNRIRNLVCGRISYPLEARGSCSVG